METASTIGLGLNACDLNGDGFEDVVVARNLATTLKGAPKTLINVDGELLLSATQEGSAANPDALISQNNRLACGDQNGDGMHDVLVRWGKTYRLMQTSQLLSRRIRLRIVGADGDRNQQGRSSASCPKARRTAS